MSYIIGSMSLAGTNSSDLDLAAAFFGQGGDVFVGDDHHLAVIGFVGPGDVAVFDDLAAYLADALVADAPVVLLVHLMELDVVVLGRAVHLDRDVHQTEGDRTLPYGTHKPRLAGLGQQRAGPRRGGVAGGAIGQVSARAGDGQRRRQRGRPHHAGQRVECRSRPGRRAVRRPASPVPTARRSARS